MDNKTYAVNLGDGTAIEVATDAPFRPTEEGYTETAQSVLYVFNDAKFNPIAACEVCFKSFGKGFDDLCEDGQLGLDGFVAKSLDGAEALRLAPSAIVSKDLLQGERGTGVLEAILGSYELCGYWLFAHQFVDGEEVASQMTLGCPDLFSLVDFGAFAQYTPSDRTTRYQDLLTA